MKCSMLYCAYQWRSKFTNFACVQTSPPAGDARTLLTQQLFFTMFIKEISFLTRSKISYIVKYKMYIYIYIYK